MRTPSNKGRDRSRNRTFTKDRDARRSSVGGNRTPGTSAGLAPPARGVWARMAGVVHDWEAAVIEVARIAPDPEQPRRDFDEESIARLAESLKTRGQLQNVVVYWAEEIESYVLVSGERRWRAARRAGLTTLRCKVLDRRPDDAERLSIQLIENCVREDLRPVEQAAAFRSLMENHGWSTRQLAEALNMAQAKVVYSLGLLDLSDELRDRVDRGEIAPRTAYEIGRLDRPEDQAALAARVLSEGLTRDDVIAEVRATRPPEGESPPGRRQSRSKGRGGATGSRRGTPARLLISRTLRFPGGKVTIEKAGGIDASAYRDAARMLLLRADRLEHPPDSSLSPDCAPPSADSGADSDLAA